MSPLKGVGGRLAARWRSLEPWVGSRSSAVALFALALAVFALQSLVLPVYPGRDMDRYLQTFVQLGYHVPVYPPVLNTRGPLAALGVGVPLEIGAWAAEIWLAVLYALSIVAWGRVALTFGTRAAVLTTGLLLVYPGYGILFHQLASDSLFAAAFAGWAVLVTRAMLRPSVKAFLFVGLGVGVLALVRPANQVLIVMALLPLLLRASWRERLSWLAAFFVAAVGVTQGWKAIAELRYGVAVALKPSTGLIALAIVLIPLLLAPPWRRRVVLVLALAVVAAVAVKGWPGQSPMQYVRSVKQNESNQFLYRAFELERIISPDNGPASRRLADVVQRKLLTREPYRSYGVDIRTFFSSGSDRVFGDLTGVADPAVLAAATREAIRRQPRKFVGGIARTVAEEVWNRPVYAPTPTRAGSARSSGQQATDYVVIDGRRLPKPSEGQPIPSSAIGPTLWTPGGPAGEVWRSPTNHQTVFTDPQDKRRFDEFERDVSGLTRIPNRDGNGQLVHWLNRASHGFPPLIVWLVIGMLALALRRPKDWLVAIAPSVAALIVIAATSLVAPSVAEYAAPVSPAFIMLTAAGLLGASGMRSASPAAAFAARCRRLARTGRPAGIAAGLVAVAWGAWHYISSVNSSFDSARAPHDLAVFLNAAASLVHGHSPYAYRADETYAYPPLAALLATPLHPLGAGAATLMWTLLSLCAIGSALWLLGVRDWRCFALTAVYPVTRSAVDLGTIGPLLLLAVAAGWRWRDGIAGPVGVAAAVALKLFLWPLVVWLALTRRLTAALVTVGLALAFVFVPWAVLGFAGLTGFPALLRHLSDDEASSSYSLVALAVRAHLPQTVGLAVSLLATAVLLGAAAFVARDGRLTRRDRDIATLTLALAAGLAASPIVWAHYFLLLLVPLALARPRLSALWAVPLAYYPLGETAWPAGDARKLALALVTTLLLLAVPLVGSVRGRPRFKVDDRARVVRRRDLAAGSREVH